ncbi:hypothetical protein FSP39_023886 [Pinctada imbricata]|uniref:C3H1-type domain-containing protein n=1 Tax=Pinctada imbricata TaxID=66713 RepID=A0AA88YCR4_PINIB|nr:hypothetical protein FSP39_023886 [Pinctada imbricata]
MPKRRKTNPTPATEALASSSCPPPDEVGPVGPPTKKSASSRAKRPDAAKTPPAPVPVSQSIELPQPSLLASGQGSSTNQSIVCDNDDIQPIISIHSQIGSHVPESTRKKIISGEYVDLSILLNKTPETNPDQILTIKNGSLISKPKHVNKINDIEKWTDAFLIYASIYASVHTDKFQGLLKYMQNVRTGASRSPGLGWRHYDEQFRLKMTMQPELYWGSIDYELWLLYLPSHQAQAQAQPQFQRLKCYDFNNKGYCGRHPCPYTHACIKCNGNHSSSVCTNSQYSPKSSTYQTMSHNNNRFPSQRFQGQRFSARTYSSNFQKPRNFRPRYQ